MDGPGSDRSPSTGLVWDKKRPLSVLNDLLSYNWAVHYHTERPSTFDSTLISVIMGGWNIIWNNWARINCLCWKYFCWYDRIATSDKTFHWWFDQIWNLLRHGFRIRFDCWISSWCLYQNGVRNFEFSVQVETFESSRYQAGNHWFQSGAKWSMAG